MIGRKELERHMLAWRGVETPCAKCGGAGVYVYGSTSTWRGGMGGSRMTRDICDQCWGSGDAERPWMNLRTLKRDLEQQVAARALTLLTDRLGARMKVTQPAVLALVEELERLARGRKPRPFSFPDLCDALARVLRQAVAGQEAPPTSG